ncbi:cell division ATP-binding protein FtsE [uncultured Amnibacterium sp.]|uniref:cell division ATP-binding protein FtsE n=1 Tax=uncultured Amnibacterium sp. TaxID=1631851 RepID=UPI0035C9BF1E
MIRFDSVTKTYRGGSRPALDGISLEIGSGEFVFLVGASGSGKSSLLRLILREDRPTTGEIHVLGQRLTTISARKVPYFRRTLGVVFQDFRLLPNKTVYANVAFTLQVIGKSRGFIQEAVPDVLRMVGLQDKARSLPNELSGGEQQRVAIARAVVNKPAVLLADEPTGNLDPTTSDEIMQVLATINASGTTVVMATHDVTIVDRMQRRVVELIDGRIVRDELEATYVTSAVPVQAARTQKPARSQPAAAPTGSSATARLAHAEPSRTEPSPTEAMADAGPQPWLSRWLLTDDEPDPMEPTAAPASTGSAAPARTPQSASVPSGAVQSAPVPSAAVQTETAPNPAPVRRWATARTPTAPVRIAPAPPASAEPPTPHDDSLLDHDLELDLDVDARLRSTAKHREPLPQHLDFLAGLGLRGDAEPTETGAEKTGSTGTGSSTGTGTVGPSS